MSARAKPQEPKARVSGVPTFHSGRDCDPVVAPYDNSSVSRFNPNPNVWVHEGNQAGEETVGVGTWFVVETDVNERELTDRPARAPGA